MGVSLDINTPNAVSATKPATKNLRGDGQRAINCAITTKVSTPAPRPIEKNMPVLDHDKPSARCSIWGTR
ncbi:hypothetical protein D3C77_616530 [compost metagenome]